MFLQPGVGGTVFIDKTDLKKFIQVHLNYLRNFHNRQFILFLDQTVPTPLTDQLISNACTYVFSILISESKESTTNLVEEV